MPNKNRVLLIVAVLLAAFLSLIVGYTMLSAGTYAAAYVDLGWTLAFDAPDSTDYWDYFEPYDAGDTGVGNEPCYTTAAYWQSSGAMRQKTNTQTCNDGDRYTGLKMLASTLKDHWGIPQSYDIVADGSVWARMYMKMGNYNYARGRLRIFYDDATYTDHDDRSNPGSGWFAYDAVPNNGKTIEAFGWWISTGSSATGYDYFDEFMITLDGYVPPTPTPSPTPADYVGWMGGGWCTNVEISGTETITSIYNVGLLRNASFEMGLGGWEPRRTPPASHVSRWSGSHVRGWDEGSDGNYYWMIPHDNQQAGSSLCQNTRIKEDTYYSFMTFDKADGSDDMGHQVDILEAFTDEQIGTMLFDVAKTSTWVTTTAASSLYITGSNGYRDVTVCVEQLHSADVDIGLDDFVFYRLNSSDVNDFFCGELEDDLGGAGIGEGENPPLPTSTPLAPWVMPTLGPVITDVDPGVQVTPGASDCLMVDPPNIQIGFPLNISVTLDSYELCLGSEVLTVDEDNPLSEVMGDWGGWMSAGFIGMIGIMIVGFIRKR